MTFEEVIVKETQNRAKTDPSLKMVQLYSPAVSASKDPKQGITIQNKAAYYVIRDCATTTVKYFPILCYGLYESPIDVFRGKFSDKQIKEFAAKTETDIIAKQLLTLILNDANIDQDDQFDYTEESDSIYGEYGYSATETKKSSVEELLLSIF